ncbi:hypothetical protein [Streptomyces aquilus]|uniref:hypothetical protein n=1 Tax=Streptomyces aquilus TaxID=2548456 RepID=UPI0036B4F314
MSVTTTATPEEPAGGGAEEITPGSQTPETNAEAPEVQWSGPLLSQNQAFDLDVTPPAIGGSDLDPYGYEGEEVQLVTNNYALVPEGEEPGFNECPRTRSPT